MSGKGILTEKQAESMTADELEALEHAKIYNWDELPDDHTPPPQGWDDTGPLSTAKAPPEVPHPVMSEADASKLTADELEALADHAEAPSLGSKALDAAAWIGQQYDRFGGASTRKAVGELQKEGPPLDLIKNAGSAFLGQWGKTAGDDVPTGEDIALKGGATPGLPAQAAGVALDALLDTTNLIPLVGHSKFASRVLGKTAQGVGKGVEVTAKIAAGDGAEAAAKGLNEGIASLGKTMGSMIKPKLSMNYEEAVALAEANRIDPSTLSASIKYGRDSFIDKAKRVKAQGPVGQPLLEAHAEGLNQIRAAVDRDLTKMGKSPALDPVAAGDYIRQAHAEAVDGLFNNIEVTYNSVLSDNPGLHIPQETAYTLSKEIQNSKAKMERIIKLAPSEARVTQATRTIDRLNKVQGALKSPKFEVVLEQMRDVGELGYKYSKPLTANDIPLDAEVMRDLYTSMRKTLLDTTEELVGPDVAAQLATDNKTLTEFFKQNAHLEKIITDTNAGGEKVFSELIQRADTVKMKALKEVLSHGNPASLDRIKASYLENLKLMDKDGGFSFARLHSTLRNDDKTVRVLKTLFDPEELANFNNLVKLGDDYGPPILNTSGTEVSNTFNNVGNYMTGVVGRDALVKYMEELAAKNTGVIRARAERMAKKAGASPSEIQSFHQVAEYPQFLEGLDIRNLGPREAVAKGLKLIAIQHQNQERKTRVKVEEDVMNDVRQEIKDDRGMSNIKKAQNLDSLNRYGELFDVSQFGRTPAAGPVYNGEVFDPRGPDLPKRLDTLKSLKPEPEPSTVPAGANREPAGESYPAIDAVRKHMAGNFIEGRPQEAGMSAGEKSDMTDYMKRIMEEDMDPSRALKEQMLGNEYQGARAVTARDQVKRKDAPSKPYKIEVKTRVGPDGKRIHSIKQVYEQ